MNSQDVILGATIALMASFTFGYRAIIAWFVPAKHQKHLERWGESYRGWSSTEEMWWRSKMNFWVMRIAYTIGFFLFVYAFLAILGLA